MRIPASHSPPLWPTFRSGKASQPAAEPPRAESLTPAPQDHPIASARARLAARGLAPPDELLQAVWRELEGARIGGHVLASLFHAVCASATSELELAFRCRSVVRACSQAPPMVTLPSVPGEKAQGVFSSDIRSALGRELLIPEPDLEPQFRRLFLAGGDLQAALDALALADLPAGADRAERLRCLERLLSEVKEPGRILAHFSAVATYRPQGSNLLESAESYLQVRDRLARMGKPEGTAQQVYPYVLNLQPSPWPAPVSIPVPALSPDQRAQLLEALGARFSSEVEAHYSSVLGNRLEGERPDSAWSRYLYLADALTENGKPAELLPQLFRLISGWSTGPDQGRRLLLDFRARLSQAATVTSAVDAIRPQPGIEVDEHEVRVGRQRLPRRRVAIRP